ncbi:MAG: hypothetical protein ACJ8F3_21160 [Xanthobacteraceae bacterium]
MLRVVAGGVDYRGGYYRVTIDALRRRGLIKLVAGGESGGAWRITAAGRKELARHAR